MYNVIFIFFFKWAPLSKTIAFDFEPNVFLQKKLMTIINTSHCLYYVNVPDPAIWNLEMLASLSNMAMESVWKEHMTTFHKSCPFVTPHLALNFSNKYKFITTWILIPKWWLRSYSCLCLCKWAMSKRFIGPSSGTSP
jgi:hypothetical protein